METVAMNRVPQPRSSGTGASPYEQGSCGTPLLHAAHKTLQGHKALCDGSPIVEWRSGRFDSAAAEACPDCAAASVNR